MVGDELDGRPRIDDVWSVLFERFCEHCSLGEEGCVPSDAGSVCPAFLVIRMLLPDNPFVLRATGRHITCPRCHGVGMTPPRYAFDSRVQPVLVCRSCHAPLWRGRNGMLVDRAEDTA